MRSLARVLASGLLLAGVLATNTASVLAETTPEQGGTAGITQTDPSAPIESPTTVPPTTTTTTAPPTTTTTAPPTTTTTEPPTATTQPELLQAAPAEAPEAAEDDTGTLSITKEVIGSSGGTYTINYRGPCIPGAGHCTQDHGGRHEQDGFVGSVTLDAGETQTVTVSEGNYVISEPVVPDGATVSYSATQVQVTEGGTAAVTVTNTYVDTTVPEVTIRTPVNGGDYEINSEVPADFECSDEGGSGIAEEDGCVGTVGDGELIDTSSLGEKSFTVTATDADGNETEVTHVYDVVDTGVPEVTIRTPVNGGDYEINSEVPADFECSDEGGSGIAEEDGCVGTVGDGELIDTSSLGEKSFTVTATDADGNETEVTHVYDVVDTGVPEVTIRTPVNGGDYEINSEVPADFECSDEGGSGIAEEDGCVGTVGDGELIDTSSLGEKSFTVTATDADGNETEVTHVYDVVDTGVPEVTIRTPVNGGDYEINSEVPADFECSDEGGSGIAEEDGCVGTVGDGELIDTSSLGEKSFTVTATDADGNETEVTHVYDVVDTGVPEVTIRTPVNGGDYEINSEVPADFECSDEGGSGIAEEDGCVGTVGDGELIDTSSLGEKSFTVTATDADGNETEVTHVYDVVDTGVPEVTIRTPVNGGDYEINSEVPADFECSDEGGSGIAEEDGCVGTVGDGELIDTSSLGEKSFTVTATDADGNETEVTHVYDVVDTGVPEVTIRTPVNGGDYEINSEVPADFECSDEGGSGIAEEDGCVGTVGDGELIDTSSLGEKSFTVTATDADGNETEVTHVYDVVDTGVPEVTIRTPVNGGDYEINSEVPADFECSDEGGSGIAEEDGCVGTVGDGELIDTSSLGEKSFTVTATDADGNETEVTHVYDVVDTGVPEVTIRTPVNGGDYEINSEVPADFECSDEGGSGIAEEDGCVGTVGDGELIDTSSLGEKSFTVTATDADGNETEVTHVYDVVDTGVPEVTIRTPVNGGDYEINSEVPADFECSDEGGSGIAEEDGCVGTVGDGELIDTSSLGEKSFTVTATDADGNETEVTHVYDVVDTGVPEVTIRTPVNGGDYEINSEVPADFECSDEGGSGIAEEDGCVGTVGDGELIDTSSLGEKSFTVTATDADGNETEVTHVYDVVDTGVPEVTIRTPVNGGDYEINSEVPADFECSDEGGSGIAEEDGCVGTVGDGELIDTSSLGEKSFTVTATDADGNETEVTHVYDVVDTGVPEVTIRTPVNGGDYEINSEVPADFECSDEGGSGIAEEDGCVGTVGDGELIDTSSLGEKSFTVTATDADGNETEVTHVYDVVDTGVPEVTIRTPVNGGDYEINSEVPADFECSDEGGSGIAEEDGCVGTVGDGELIDTSSLGEKSFTVTATDADGNETEVTHVYDVVDTGVPEVTIRTPVNGGDYEINSEVPADFECSDEGGSGIAEEDGCVGTVGDGELIDTSSLGEKSFTVTATDADGNETEVTHVYDVVDTGVPEVTIRTPVNGGDYEINSEVPADFECSDEGGSGIAEEDGCVGTVGDGELIDTSSLGEKSFTVTATDADGNETEVTHVYDVVDTGVPEVTIRTPVNGGDYEINSEVPADFECSDEGGSGIAEEDGCVGTVGDGELIDTSSLGEKSFTVTATDADGNETEVTHVYDVVDTGVPEVTIRTPVNGGDYEINSEVPADFECSDEGGSGIAEEDGCVGTVGDGELIDTSSLGEKSFTVTATDADGNETEVTHVYDVVDTGVPEVTIRTPVNGGDYEINSEVPADFECSDEGGSGIAEEDGCVGTVGDGELIDTSSLGEKSFTVTATDADGNETEVTHVYDVVDTGVPEVTIRTPVNGGDYEINSEVPADFECSDEGGSGIAEEDGCVGTVGDGELIDTSSLGEKSFTVTATDADGNETEVTHVYDVVDTGVPEVTIRTPVNGGDYEINSEVPADFECSDEGGSGIAEEDGCVGTVGDGELIDTSSLGEKSFTVTATDADGNETEVTHVYDVVDTGVPEVTIRTPVNGGDYEINSEVPADFECSDEGGSGIAEEDGCVGTVGDGELIDTSSLGEKSFTVTATDADGNETEVTHVYDVVDTGVPEVTIRTPVNGGDYEINSEVPADFECSDEGGSGIAEEDGCVGTVGDGELIDTSSLGEKSFTVTATDADGNETEVTHVYDVVDTSDPKVTIRTSVGGATFEINQVVTANFGCSDPGSSGINTCVGDVDDGSPLATSSLGRQSFTVVGTDKAGNSTTVTYSYTVVDTSDPDVTITTPADGAALELDEIVNADFACSDPSGIASCVATGAVRNGDPIDTSTPGPQSFTVTGTDKGGNSKTVTHMYTVVEDPPPPEDPQPVPTVLAAELVPPPPPPPVPAPAPQAVPAPVATEPGQCVSGIPEITVQRGDPLTLVGPGTLTPEHEVFVDGVRTDISIAGSTLLAATDRLEAGPHEVTATCRGELILERSFTVFFGVASTGTAGGMGGFLGIFVAFLTMGLLWRVGVLGLAGVLAMGSRRDNDA